MSAEILNPDEVREFALGILFPLDPPHNFCRDLTYAAFLNNCQAVRAMEDDTQKMVELRFRYEKASNSGGCFSFTPIRFRLDKKTSQVECWRSQTHIIDDIPQKSDENPDFRLQIDDLRDIEVTGDSFVLRGNLGGVKNYKSLLACD